MRFGVLLLAVLQLGSGGHGFKTSGVSLSYARRLISQKTKPYSLGPSSLAIATSSSGDESVDTGRVDTGATEQKKKERKALIRQEGGIFAFDTKYGALNPFAIYYGLVAIFLGMPWFLGLSMCQIFYFVTRNKIDKQVRCGLPRRRGWLSIVNPLYPLIFWCYSISLKNVRGRCLFSSLKYGEYF